MANNFFQFKQFIVYQQHCAMKVSTDSCIFGAVTASFFGDVPEKADTGKCYLDIGTGTGVLSMMLAQQTTAAIDAVEIDNAAFEQATQNFSASPFWKQLTAHHTDVLKFEPGKKYNGILCNPPFFEGDLQSDNAMKNAAKHSTTFTLQQLLTTADRLLTVDGILAVLLPYHRVDAFIQSANDLQFFLQEQILVRHTTTHPYFRGILFLSRQQSTAHTKELVIKNEGNVYTDAFIDLLKDYYL
ncbi:methyltransferase [Ferruginibacter paludis]|uniref:tRNA1(Val) (adenine(37)-N6)-methyltransferase n=1 Tax=Ferruginibacter paludis TaxID=1310417 RepID=UPI0025B4DD8C|nr:methyltransferase [Ferruginibacter paludis]MDN3656827.1 methyltransferase [Ferruginibacter paludis]